MHLVLIIGINGSQATVTGARDDDIKDKWHIRSKGSNTPLVEIYSTDAIGSRCFM